MNKLLLQKMLMAFLVTFGGVIIPAMLNVLDDIHNGVPHHFDSAFWIAMAAGAFGAAVRAVLALSPINIVPSDAQHTLFAKHTGTTHHKP